MDDIKDILNISRNENKAKNEVISREIINLTGGIPPIKPSFSKQMLKGIKEKRLDKKGTEKWIWSPFHNPARGDNLKLCHWKKQADSEEYPFSKFNKKIEIVEYTDEEYESVPENPLWTRQETDYLWSLCKLYDLRFIIIQDRYEPLFQNRSVEDLKERYYSIAKSVLQIRAVSSHPILNLPYNANYEKKRKALLEKYFLRTREQDEEEKSLCEEARKLEIKIKKEEKELKVFEKLMSNNSEEIEFSEWSQNKKELPKGPSLRSTQLNQPALPQRQQKKIETLLKDLGVPDRPMPTSEVVEQFIKLRKEIYILLNLQKHVIKKENEKKNLEDKIKELKSSAGKKNQSISNIAIRSPTTIGSAGKSMMAKNPSSSTKQIINPLNNFPKKTPVKRNESEDFESTPVKKGKKTNNP
jgi:DNA methyltransferase 1-associated protein 1